MTPLSVGLVAVGERLPIELAALAKKLNALQDSYKFEDASVITADALGKADVLYKWFEIPRLLNLVGAMSATSHDFVVGVVDRRLTHSEELRQFADPELDYFSRSDLCRYAVVSVHDSVFKYSPPGTELEQYAAFLIIVEVLIMTAKADLNHDDNPDCALHECGDRSALKNCLKRGVICASCRAALKRANVSERVISSVEHVLKWSATNSWWYSAKTSLDNPAITLLLGSGIGWLVSALVPWQFFPVVAVVTLLPFFVGIFAARRAGFR